MLKLVVVVTVMCTLAGCPPQGTQGGGRTAGGGGGGGGGGAGIDPDACGSISTSAVGRKLYSFLQASAELDRASLELEGTVHGACGRMAAELGVSGDGDTRALCTRAAQELQANLQVSVKTEKRLVTRYSPPVCHTDIDFGARVVAECEGSASADVGMRCEGRCSGTCDGTCSGGNAGGQCNGTCDGRCHGGCDGYANAHASAECRASAEVRTNLHTECSEPKVEVVQQDVTIVDATKFNRAIAAINAGMPQILRATAKLERAGKAVANWASTGASLVASSGELIADLGEKGLCVSGQLAGVLAASTQIEARFSVSIEVSAQVSGSAGATAR